MRSNSRKQNEPGKRRFDVWGNRWFRKRVLPGGGQSLVFLVSDSSSDEIGSHFLKTPRTCNARNIARLKEEVAALQLMAGTNGVPQLVDFSTDVRQPFIVMEFISGEPLHRLIDRNCLSYADATVFLLGLLRILESCHSRDLVHRDLKPGNIILRNGRYNEPVLVDFGIGFRKSSDRDEVTRKRESFGNSFIEPPETMPGSPNQRSPIQDLTAACGLLLYVLTGDFVGQLMDDAGQMPHQRKNAQAELHKLQFWERTHLVQIFDRAFNHDIRKRFQTVQELQKLLLSAVNFPSPVDVSAADKLAQIKARYVSPATDEPTAAQGDTLRSVTQLILNVYKEIENELGPGFLSRHVMHDTFGASLSCSLDVTLFHESDDRREFRCIYTVTKVGTEIVVNTDHPTVKQLGRTMLDNFTAETAPHLVLRAKQFVSDQLHRRLLMPNMEFGHYQVYSALRNRLLHELRNSIMKVRNHHEVACALGFQELSWLLRRDGIVLEWTQGSTCVVTEEGPQDVDDPSMLRLSAEGTAAILEIWTDGHISAYHRVVRDPPFHEQHLVSNFPHHVLEEILKNVILPPLKL